MKDAYMYIIYLMKNIKIRKCKINYKLNIYISIA